MTKEESTAELKLDRPLQSASALEADTLGRQPFARRVAEVLQRISPEAGLVVSVEGSWGCGKTSRVRRSMAKMGRLSTAD